MLVLPQAAHSYGTPQFAATLKAELERLDIGQLPLQQAMTQGGCVVEGDLEASVLAVADTADRIIVRVGVFFRSVIAGCSCADDPTPIEPIAEYCELELRIARADGQTRVTLAGAD